MMDFQILVADQSHFSYAETICLTIAEAAKARGTGIAKRKPTYIKGKIEEGKAIIALENENFVGFCYIETWEHGKYAANSGLIVSPEYRNHGLAKKIKAKAFELSRKKFPDAKLFGITTSLPVMKINSELGYKPVTFSELTEDEEFWAGCNSCPNFDVLSRNERKLCLCTAMLYDPNKEKASQQKKEIEEIEEAESLHLRWQQYKAHLRKRSNNPILQKIKNRIFGKAVKVLAWTKQ